MAAMRLMLLLLLACLCFARALQAGAPDCLKDGLNKENGMMVSDDDIADTVEKKNYFGGRRVRMARKSMEIKVKEMVKTAAASHGVDEGGLAALTADYHSPRQHPPKNN